MYTKIDTGHALRVLRWFLEELKREGKFLEDFDIDMIIEAATIVMRWNIVEFGDVFLKQLIGTAMGTPAAVTWATIYFYWHELHVLIPKYGRKMILNYRFVDDIWALALFGGDDGFSPNEFDEFKQDMNNFGLLKWKVNEPSTCVNFLDLTLTIENGLITSKTYQKPTNLYQYICRNSAHPPWMIKGVIYSMLRRYHRQNTKEEDYWKVSMKYYNHLKDRGWTRQQLEPIFISAHDKIINPDKTNTKKANEMSNREIAILHMEYNKFDIPRWEIREIWNETCSLLEQDVSDGGLGIKRMICAYSRPKNLRDLLQSAKLRELEGHEASTYF